MKNKLSVTINGVKSNRVCSFEKENEYHLLKYTEQPNQKVEIKFFKDYCQVKKIGTINMSINHVVGNSEEIKYEINLNGNKFDGVSSVKTIKFKNEELAFILEYIVNDESFVQKWEVS